MIEHKPIIVDTNILFSSLLQQTSHFYEILITEDFKFYICELTLVELFRHKEKLIKTSKLTEDDIIKFYYLILKRINIFKEDLIKLSNWYQAFEYCKDIDEADTPFIALTLELNGLLFTGDKAFKQSLLNKGFDSFFEYKKVNK